MTIAKPLTTRRPMMSSCTSAVILIAFMPVVVQGRNAATHQNAAEHARFRFPLGPAVRPRARRRSHDVAINATPPSASHIAPEAAAGKPTPMYASTRSGIPWRMRRPSHSRRDQPRAKVTPGDRGRIGRHDRDYTEVRTVLRSVRANQGGVVIQILLPCGDGFACPRHRCIVSSLSGQGDRCTAHSSEVGRRTVAQCCFESSSLHMLGVKWLVRESAAGASPGACRTSAAGLLRRPARSVICAHR